MKTFLILTLAAASVYSDQSRYSNGGGGGGFGGGFGNGGGGIGRDNSGNAVSIPGGVDFSGCEPQPDGTCCVVKESRVTSLQKDPLLECTHKNVEKCHYTYITQFSPAQEEVCEENFEKKCQITFRQVAQRDKVQKCITPLRKVCDNNQPTYGAQPSYGGPSNGGGGQTECRTFYESSCTTRYIEKRPGQFVGDTTCEKRPVELCGQGCRMEQDAPQCHDKEIDVLVDVPEEVCDLNPQKTCRFQTKLVPSLKPTHECTVIPQEVCNLKFTPPRQTDKPLQTRWCIDPNAPVEAGETYESQAAYAPPVSYGASASAPQSYSQPAPAPAPTPSYSAAPLPPAPAPSSYSQPAAPAPSSYSQPASNSYSQPAAPAPAPSSYSQPAAAPAPSSYSQPASNSYSQPAAPAPAPSSYSQPAAAPAPSSYSQPAAAPAPSSYSQPAAAPAPSSYSQPASDSYSQPAAAPAPSSYSEPAADSYSQPSAPAPSQPTYGNAPPAPQPSQPYYKPIEPSSAPDSYGVPSAPSAPALPAYGASQPQYGGFRAKV